MKILKALAFVTVLTIPAVALAALDIDPTHTISIGSQMIRPSNNVDIHVISNSTANAFACAAGHTKGDRIFATSSADNKIYYQDSIGTTITSTVLAAKVSASVVDFTAAGWSAL